MKLPNVFASDGIYNVTMLDNSAIVALSNDCHISTVTISLDDSDDSYYLDYSLPPMDGYNGIIHDNSSMFPYPFMSNAVYAVLVMGDNITITDDQTRLIYCSSPRYTRVLSYSGTSIVPVKEWDSITNTIHDYNHSNTTTVSPKEYVFNTIQS